MKVKSKRRLLSSLLVTLLVCIMAVASGCSGLIKMPSLGSGNSSDESSDSYILNQSFNTSDPTEHIDKSKLLTEDAVTTLSDSDDITLLVKVSERSVYTMYKESGSDLTFQEYMQSRDARVNSEKLSNKHNEIFNKLSKKIDATLLGSVTGLVNSFSIRIKYADRKKADEFALKYGAISTTISDVFAQPEVQSSDDGIVYNSIDVYDTGIFSTEGLDYQGEGMVVAVLDTGLDYEHKAFSTNNLPLKQDGSIDYERLGFTKSDVNGKVKDLFAANLSVNLTVDDVYVNEKVPYAYDYADKDPEVNTTELNSHGTHVAGIIAGQSLEKGDEGWRDASGNLQPGAVHDLDVKGNPITGITGVAPKAQLAIMKVFSDYSTGTEEDTLLYAVNDCAVLGVDVVNMSLGSNAGFSDLRENNSLLQDAYNRISELGINLVVAAGNSYSAGFGGHYGTNLTSNPDSGVVGAPSALYASFSVASINGIRSPYFEAVDNAGNSLGIAYYTESARTDGLKNDFIDNLIAAVAGQNICGGVSGGQPNGIDYTLPENGGYYNAATNTYKIPFVVIPGLGDSGNYMNSVQGKIVLIQRGVTTFTEKLTMAKSKNALAAVITNHVAGTISMATEEEVNEHYTFPACSITMDSARPIRAAVEGWIIISEDFGGGPFMSEFSSWGPTPSLELKPEITGHGGEIYSAFPGGKYDRISGTSMACPNIAGLVAIMRQYIISVTTAENDPYAVKNSNGQIDYTVLEDRIYQLMMSTAISPLNQYGDPYSPRKTGAGVANIRAMMETGAYLTVKGDDGLGTVVRDRTKIELYDDKQREGVYEMGTTINNISNKDIQYKLSADVLTETVSSDGESVAERSYPLNGVKEWSIAGSAAQGSYNASNGIVTVKAGQTLDVKLKVSLTLAEKKYIADNFENGMYVEGFVRLTAQIPAGTSEQDAKLYADLSVPYLAFFGDWTDAPLYDYSIFETDPDDKNTNMDDDKKRYAQNKPMTPYAKLIQNGNEYFMSMGNFAFNVPEELENQVPYADETKTTLTFNESTMFELYYMAGTIRAAKYTTYRIIDVTTGRVLYEGDYYNARKSGAISGVGGVKLEIDPKDIGCRGGGTYRFEMECFLDYDYDKTDPNARPSAGTKPKEDGTSTNAWGFNFTIDTDAPILYDAEIRFERTSAKTYDKFLDVYVRDEHYSQAIGFDLYDKTSDTYKNYYERGLRPTLGSKNSITKITYDLTNYWDSLKQNEVDGKWRAAFSIYDYGFNNSYYEIDLKKLALEASTIDLIDIGTYNTYRNGSDTLRVLNTFANNYELDEFGNPADRYYVGGELNTISHLNIRPGQKVELANALYMQPKGASFEDLNWTATKDGSTDVVQINTKTGEILALNAGTTTITIASAANPSASTSITVTVLSQEIMDESNFNIPPVADAYLTLQNITFDERFPDSSAYYPNGYKVLKPGEEYVVTFNLNPWFNNARIQEFYWLAGAPATSPVTLTPIVPNGFEFNEATSRYVLIDPNSSISLSQIQAVIRAKEGTYADITNYYTPNRTGMLTVNCFVNYFAATNTIPKTLTGSMNAEVLPEFEIENNILVKYNGMKADVLIPFNETQGQSIKVLGIGDQAFRAQHHVTRVVIPEGVTDIGTSAFASMKGLNEVILPSTLQNIGNWAFSAYNDPVTGVTTSLQIVDNTTTPMRDPARVGYAAFKDQKALGSAFTYVNDERVNSPDGRVSIDNKFNIGAFRTVDSAAFLNCYHLWDIDLTNVRSMNTLSFAFAGVYGGLSAINNLPDYEMPQFKFGPLTAVGTASFLLSGVVDLSLPMNRIAPNSFEYSPFITTLEFTADNLVIGDSAFSKTSNVPTNQAYSTGLISVTFKGSVEYIGKYAFSESLFLETVVFEKTAKKIDTAAFAATPLKSFTLPAGLEYLGDSVFEYCQYLTKINIAPDFMSDNLDLKNAFTGTNINTLTFNNVSSGSNSKIFVQNNMLLSANKEELIFAAPASSSITLPPEVNYIRPYALSTSRITSFTGNGIVEIGAGAFMNAENLTSFTATSLTAIPDYAFSGVTKLTSINLGTAKINSIGKYAFANTSISAIPNANIETLGEIGEGAFMGNTKIASFTVPVGITDIPADLFNGCTSLSEVNFHSGVRTIGDKAFAYTAITELTGNQVANITQVGRYAFAACSSLARVELPSLLVAGYGAFGINVTEIILTTIDFKLGDIEDDQGFKEDIREDVVEGQTIVYGGTSALTTLSINSITTINGYAFNGQSKLTSVNLPNAITIGARAFADTSIQSLSFPKVTRVGDYAFLNCPLTDGNTTTLNIPASLTNIGIAAFAGNELTAFSVDPANTEYSAKDGVLFRSIQNYAAKGNGLKGFELIQYPDGDTSKSNYVIPEQTLRINDYAFYLVKTLESVTLPMSLTNIGHGAFFQTPNLKNYTFLSYSAPTLESWYGYDSFSDDLYKIYWAYFNNFYDNFSVEAYENDGADIVGNWLFNGLTSSFNVDKFQGYNREIVGNKEGSKNFSGLDYGLSMIYPTNGVAYDSFIYSNYFTNKSATAKEAASADTQTIINDIRSLPSDFSTFTYVEVMLVQATRLLYNQLSTTQKAYVTNISILQAAENYIANNDIPTVTITFMVGRVVYETQTVMVAGRAKLPSVNPIVDHGFFMYWEQKANKEFDFDSTPIITNITLYARFDHDGTQFMVSFEDCDLEPFMSLAGFAIDIPQEPTKKGYTFIGWQLNGEEYDLDAPLTGNITLKAIWQEDKKGCGCGTIDVFNPAMLATFIGVFAAASLLILKKRQNKLKKN